MRGVWAPPGVKAAMRRLHKAGFEAWLVGGCVRDFCLGLPSKDFDIASSAKPEEVKALFAKTWDTGLAYGTVTVEEEGLKIEVTAFRKEEGYADHRRPAAVDFSAGLYDDLSRRDFTINAMAWQEEKGLVDPFGGTGDLERRLIRCVGDPEARFSEDALRMLRGVRFCARLGFVLEEGTRAALVKNAPLAAKLSAERVRKELWAIFASPRPEEAGRLVTFGLLDAYLIRPKGGEGFSFSLGLPPEGGEEMAVAAAFFIRLAKAGAVSSVPECLRRLKLDNKTRKLLSAAALFTRQPPASPAHLKERLCRLGLEGVRTALLAEKYLSGEDKALLWLSGIEENNEPYLPAHLALPPKELWAMGYRGEDMRRAIGRLLALVWQNPAQNTREELSKSLPLEGKVARRSRDG